MTKSADRMIPFWVKGLPQTYSLDKLPCWFCPGKTSEWTRWISGKTDVGWWIKPDPFPEDSARLVNSTLITLQVENRLDNLNLVQISSLLTRLHGSDDLRFTCRNLFTSHPVHSGQSDFDKDLVLENFNLAISVRSWLSYLLDSNYVRPPGEPGPKLIIPDPLESERRYWLAEVSRSSETSLVILETPKRTDLGYCEHVSVWAYGQKVELYLPVPALWLDHEWPRLPTVLAMAYRDRRYFQAYRGPSGSLPTKDLTYNI